MPSKPVVQHFWTTSFYALPWSEHASETPGIIEYLYELKDQQESNIASGIAPGAKSPEGLHESDFDLFDRDHSGLNKLQAFINAVGAQAGKKISGADAERFIADARGILDVLNAQ